MKNLFRNKHSRRILSTALFTSLASSASAATVGHWRFEEGVNDGDPVVNAIEFGGNTNIDANVINGSPVYSTNVPNKPGFAIFDGTNPVPLVNTKSLRSPNSAGDHNAATPNHADLNTAGDFTIEFFASVTVEPGGFGTLARRQGGTGRLNFEFDWSNNTSRFGSLRVTNRASTNTFSTGRTANGGDVGQFFVDTNANDNDPNAYGGTPTAEGNGTDDEIDVNGGTGTWHHFAFTYESATTTGNVYQDGTLMDTWTVTDGYNSNPGAGWNLGRRGGGGAGEFYIDEFRITDSILAPSDFLHIAPHIPEPSAYACIFGAIALVVAGNLRRKRS